MRARRLSPEAVTRFVHVPEQDRVRARVVVVPALTPGIVAMTIDRWILVRSGRELDVDLIAHELVHVQQWRELGVLRFLVRYVGEYLRLRLEGKQHWAAYSAISFEAEARARSGA
ncbi:MAG: hypothetical protein ACXVKA_13175 [Acidimicrobiia bacterium]